TCSTIDIVTTRIIHALRPTPGHTLFPYTTLFRSKHVLSEKPMAATAEQGERLVECARARKLHYAVGYMKRHDEGVQTAKHLLERSEEHTSELQSPDHLVCRLLLEKKNKMNKYESS